KGPSAMKASPQKGTGGAFKNKTPNSSVVSFSPGYVGCSYIPKAIYSSNRFFITDTFSTEAKSLDIVASFSIPTADEAPQIFVNDDEFNLFGDSPTKKHYEDGGFDVTISWMRITDFSNFAVQFDLGVKGNEELKTTKSANGDV
ncbi:hypothetical protein PENTCL1PPCAC_15932, partial [Pristionchus entomophagus]